MGEEGLVSRERVQLVVALLDTSQLQGLGVILDTDCRGDIVRGPRVCGCMTAAPSRVRCMDALLHCLGGVTGGELTNSKALMSNGVVAVFRLTEGVGEDEGGDGDEETQGDEQLW